MKPIVAIQMDPVESINPHTDTTLLLGMEATRRGYDVYHYLTPELTFKNGEITVRARPVAFRSDPKDYHTVGQWRTLNLREAKVVLMRQDPPFDMAYITATYLLEMLAPDVLVVNDPAAVRNAPEKLMLLKEFAEFVAPTLITRDAKAIEAFYKEHGEIVLKPLYGFSGHSVKHVERDSKNLSALVEKFFAESNEPLIAQKFLPEIRQMDKRIITIDGKISAVMGRVPAEGEIRANFRVGGKGVKPEVTKRDRQIGEAVGAELAKRGILLAGLDVIGEYLNEINVTCPTGLPRSNEIYGIKQEQMLWDAIEKRLR